MIQRGRIMSDDHGARSVVQHACALTAPGGDVRTKDDSLPPSPTKSESRSLATLMISSATIPTPM